MSDKILYLDTVHIIESIPAGEFHTGRKLYDDIEPLALAVRTHEIRVKLEQVQTRQEFLARLAAIAEHARAGHSPVLHIETHGNQDGIELASREFLTWQDLKASLTAINEASNLNLLVILAACDGANLLHVIQPTERAPVRAIMGPKRTIKFGEIERATRAFYQTLFETRSARGAWTAMNDAVSSTEETFSVFPADSIFIYVFRQYLRTLCTPEELDKREARKVAEAVANGLTAERIDHFRQFFRSYVQDHPSYFAKLKRHFFFCDRYPENWERFDFTFDQCVVGLDITRGPN